MRNYEVIERVFSWGLKMGVIRGVTRTEGLLEYQGLGFRV